MATLKPFAAVRPDAKYAADVADLPYDVMSSEEARVMTEGRPLSFLHVDRAEIDFPRGTDIYSPEVYEKAAKNLHSLQERGILVKEEKPCYYIYREIMNGRAQTGIVGCASVDEYLDGTIKKHELTVEEKERDRIRHVDACDANTGVIFLAFRSSDSIKKVMEDVTEHQAPVYDFTRDDGVRHIVWVVSRDDEIRALEQAFTEVPNLYIADGHHRTASAARVALMRREQHPGYTGSEEFNFFLAAAFPSDELAIWDYNRVVRDLNGLTEEQFLDALHEKFEVVDNGIPIPASADGKAGEMNPSGDVQESAKSYSGDQYRFIKPKTRHEISMILGDSWYSLKLLPGVADESDPVKSLDCSILQDEVLAPVLGIGDPRTDSRIRFVGGIRGMKELIRLTREGAAVAFAMYPTSIEELMSVADAGLTMPPKSTWFEPKLLSGLFIHELS